MREIARKLLHRIGPMHRALNHYRGRRIHAPKKRIKGSVPLGTSYCVGFVLPRLLGPQSLVYSVGVGSDISFDLALIERFGCEVHAFDPTPMACEWIARQDLPARFKFHAIGLADSDGDVQFALPPIEGHDSFSLPDPEKQQPLISCPVRRLEGLMADLGHQQIDLLKIDIEGFEYGVIQDILASSVRPAQWLIDFHHLIWHFTADDTRAAVRAIEAAGYKLFEVSNAGSGYSFVHKSALN
jgi:FkbM family methyltransferase